MGGGCGPESAASQDLRSMGWMASSFFWVSVLFTAGSRWCAAV